MHMRLARTLAWVGLLASFIAALAIAACGTPTSSQTAPRATPSRTAAPTATPTEAPLTIVLTSSAFAPDASIPSEYTCDGANISPALAWRNVPAQTVSFLLLMEDRTGPRFTHWLLFNLPADTRALPANIPPGDQLASGARQVRNDRGVVGYIGPCPALPRGSTHDYRFTLYALDASLALGAGATVSQVLDAASGHILAQGRLVGTYKLRNA